jgi:hypothetical protein
MNQSKPYKVRRNKRLLSRLLADAAFPVLVLAVAVSQVKIGHHKKDALRQHGRQSGEVQAENGFQRSGDKYWLSRCHGELSGRRENWVEQRIISGSVVPYGDLPLCLELFPISYSYRWMVRLGQPSAPVVGAR